LSETQGSIWNFTREGFSDMQFIKNFIREEEGQDVLEYGLLMGFVAVVAYAGIQVVGGDIGTMWDKISTNVNTATSSF
jgi:Flp pilus assembly pilin Flp